MQRGPGYTIDADGWLDFADAISACIGSGQVTPEGVVEASIRYHFPQAFTDSVLTVVGREFVASGQSAALLDELGATPAQAATLAQAGRLLIAHAVVVQVSLRARCDTGEMLDVMADVRDLSGRRLSPLPAAYADRFVGDLDAAAVQALCRVSRGTPAESP